MVNRTITDGKAGFMKRWIVLSMWVVAGALGADAQVAVSDASAPQSVVLSLYDQGFGLVSELRRITPARGANRLRFAGLPPGIDPSTISFIPLGATAGLDVREQRYRHDAASAEALLRRLVGQRVEVKTASETVTGDLLHAVGWEAGGDRSSAFLVVQSGRNARVFLNAADIEQVLLPEAGDRLALRPELIWEVEAASEGPQNVRLSYRIDGLEWMASYDVIVLEDGATAYFGGRIGVQNRTQGSFSNAQIRLITTESGLARDQREATAASGSRSRDVGGGPPLRYAYRADAPTFEERVSGPAPIETFSVEGTVNLAPGDQTFLRYVQANQLPVQRFFVYDGVRFDRFQRFRRNDWNYGTESHPIVDAHLQFTNEEAEGLGVPLPPGRFRLYQRRRDGTVEFVGEDRLLSTPVNQSGHVRLGPARGLQGERERTGYVEVTPLRVYEESFRITVENLSEESAEIRVVEHLYRWHDFEIVRADAEYELVGEQTIEFRPVLRPGGRRTIHYTVRYSW